MGSYIEVDQRDILTVRAHIQRFIGSDNRVTVEELTRRVYGRFTENNRRKLRAVIHEINADPNDNLLILTDTKTGGFWLADRDPSPAVEYYNSEKSRALELMDKAGAVGKKIERMYGRDALHPQPGQGRLL